MTINHMTDMDMAELDEHCRGFSDVNLKERPLHSSSEQEEALSHILNLDDVQLIMRALDRSDTHPSAGDGFQQGSLLTEQRSIEASDDCGAPSSPGEGTDQNNNDNHQEPSQEVDVEDEDGDQEQMDFTTIKAEIEKGKKTGAKPSLSYIALISLAIQSTADGRMVLGDIYSWVANHFPYFKIGDRSWRNSIRHNLSLNECFVKAGRSENGKGNYWSIHRANTADFRRGDFRRRRARRQVRKCNARLEKARELPLGDPVSLQSSNANVSARPSYSPMKLLRISDESIIAMFGPEVLRTTKKETTNQNSSLSDETPPESPRSSTMASSFVPSQERQMTNQHIVADGGIPQAPHNEQSAYHGYGTRATPSANHQNHTTYANLATYQQGTPHATYQQGTPHAVGLHQSSTYQYEQCSYEYQNLCQWQGGQM